MLNESIVINEYVSIPRRELQFRYSRSSGPGGQHVQRTESRVELLFDLANSPSLSDEQRRLAMSRLAHRLDGAGVLHLTSQAGRSQADNREDVVQRFQKLLAAAVKPRQRRKPTRPSRAVRRQRLEAKRRRSVIKRLRRRGNRDEE